MAAWTWVTWSGAQFLYLHSVFSRPKPVPEQQQDGRSLGGGLCHLQAKQVPFFISAHGNGMVNLYDMVVTTESCEDDGCHKSPYRAVCQRWLQTEHKAKCVCANEAITTRGMQGSWLQNYSSLVWRCTSQLCFTGFSRHAWLCIQTRRWDLHCPDWCCRPCTTWPTRFASAPHNQALLPVLITKIPKTNPFWGAGAILHKAFKNKLSLFRKACYSNGIPC